MRKKVTTETIRQMKNKEKITMLTAYDYGTAKFLDEAGIDIILVGDSLGMVVLGYEDTTKVTIEDMLHHTKAVSRGNKKSLLVTDMPFLSYHTGVYDTVKNAGYLIRDGNANAVKLEGGREIIDQVKAIMGAGIPVMGHLGLTPQSINQMGGYFIQGKTKKDATKIIEDAKILEEAGVFAIVLECVPTKLAEIISSELSIPTIGIGAGVACDGQVLVTHDLLGLYPRMVPKFVKQYVSLDKNIMSAATEYVKEVKECDFPSKEHSFNINDDALSKLYGGGE